MAGRGSQAAPSSQHANANHDTSPAQDSLPDMPANIPATVPPTNKKGKNKKQTDANEVGKALAAKINQLELDAAGEKDQELEIGGFSSSIDTRESILGCMKELDLPQDMIAQAMRLLNADSNGKAMFRGGPPTPEKMEPLLADLAGVSDLLSALPNLFTAAQQKLTTLPPGLVATLEREVKKATRDLTNLLNQMDNPMAKLETLQKKYSDLLSDMKRMDRENAKNKKRADLYQKEKDQGRSQLTKTDAVKTKLESVCRELQRENKKLKEEQKRMESDEKASREELSDRADSLFWELDEGLARQENPPSQSTNLESDEQWVPLLFHQRFKTFIDQYELRESHIVSMLRTKDSEVHLNIARAEEQKRRADNETMKCRNLSTQVSTFSQTETELRSQLNIYVEKFKQVEDTLNNSNDLFLTFRKEMEEMSKKTKRLEKENLNLTRKHDLTNRNILEMAEERTKVNKEMEQLRKKNNTLESLVRRMQEQGRAPAGVKSALEGDGDDDGTESEYDEEDYEEEGSEEEEGEYDDETEDEVLHQEANAVYGPTPPTNAAAQTRVNGGVHRGVNGDVNGVKSSIAV
ncbi:uncharacterized protein KY384_001909 [Bacidia gigantensis]|uniref:uncharacterized protein n=1 Tax=Bacidia gigantensis TaxID=2732470 RepID=UPI001D04D2E4|nr:uncharacterized protein KY384_001909 [Bacidia gigantensis]KAG8533126.1 hypothetical protein KY384_001909 [Bacidia gigantensis]